MNVIVWAEENTIRTCVSRRRDAGMCVLRDRGGLCLYTSCPCEWLPCRLLCIPVCRAAGY